MKTSARTIFVSLGVFLLCADARAWQTYINDAVDGGELVNAIAADADGNVVVAGEQQRDRFVPYYKSTFDLFVAKLAGKSGYEIWRHVLDAGQFSHSVAQNFIVDAAGDVVVVGNVSGASNDVVVLKLSGTDGTELWRHAIPVNYYGILTEVLIDGAGAIFVAGVIGNGDDIGVVKLAPSDGSELWTRTISNAQYYAFARIALDASGDVILGGSVQSSFFVTKLSGADGTDRWPAPYVIQNAGNGTSGGAAGVAVEGNGDVIAGGYIFDFGLGYDQALVARLSGADGSEVWHDEVSGLYEAAIYSLALDQTGDVIAGGRFIPGAYALKLAGGDGHELWRQPLDGPQDTDGQARDLVIAPGGDVIACGFLRQKFTSKFALMRLAGADGSTVWRNVIPGRDSCLGVALSGPLVFAGGDGGDVYYHSLNARSDIFALGVNAADGGETICGDGVVQGSEVCDDGNTDDTDACKNDCTPNGSFTSATCPATPRIGCQRAYGAKGQLEIRQKADPSANRLNWKWVSSASTPLTQFGTSAGSTGFTLCLYDGTPQLKVQLTAPAGGTCAGAPCWNGSSKAFSYNDRDLTPSGIQSLVLLAGGPRAAQIKLKGIGSSLGLPPLPLTTPLTVQLLSDDGGCWTSTFATRVTTAPGRQKAVTD